MSSPGHEAEKKFWRTPELVESLPPYLDPPTILALAQAHPLCHGILRGTNNWRRFIERSCPLPPNVLTQYMSEEQIEEKMAELRPAIRIMQLMGNPRSHLLPLLDLISQRFPGFAPPRADLLPNWSDSVRLTSPGKEVLVSALGFMLIEYVEGAQGSSEQKVEAVSVTALKGPLIRALRSRMNREEGMIRAVNVSSLVFYTQADAEALVPLVQRTENFSTFMDIDICGAIGEGGWAALTEALRLLPPLMLLQALLGGGRRGFSDLTVVGRDLMLDGRREDVRAVLDALPDGSYLTMTSVKTTADGQLNLKRFEKGPGMAGQGWGPLTGFDHPWARLEQYLDNEDLFVDPEN